MRQSMIKTAHSNMSYKDSIQIQLSMWEFLVYQQANFKVDWRCRRNRMKITPEEEQRRLKALYYPIARISVVVIIKAKSRNTFNPERGQKSYHFQKHGWTCVGHHIKRNKLHPEGQMLHGLTFMWTLKSWELNSDCQRLGRGGVKWMQRDWLMGTKLQLEIMNKLERSACRMKLINSSVLCISEYLMGWFWESVLRNDKQMELVAMPSALIGSLKNAPMYWNIICYPTNMCNDLVN